MNFMNGVSLRSRARAEIETTECEIKRALARLGGAVYAGEDDTRLIREKIDELYLRLDALRGEKRCPRCRLAQSAQNKYCAQCGIAMEPREGEIKWPE